MSYVNINTLPSVAIAPVITVDEFPQYITWLELISCELSPRNVHNLDPGQRSLEGSPERESRFATGR